MKRNRTLFLMILIALTGVIALVWQTLSFQDSSKPTIRILVDQFPNRQRVDALFKMIQPLITEDHYRISQEIHLESMTLSPPNPDLPHLKFNVVRDEITRALMFMKGDADVIYDRLSIAKTEWLRKQGFPVLEHPGLNLSYLGFNLRHPQLSHHTVRLAISHALPISEWAEKKFYRWVETIPESKIQFNLKKANELLDSEFPRDSNGIRFELRYFTTPVREGYEIALMVREALKATGIKVEVIPLETSLFFSKIRSGDYDLFSSRWLRFDAMDSTHELLSKNGTRNYFFYFNPETEKHLSKSHTGHFKDMHSRLERDLPFFPLFTWKHGLVLHQRIQITEKTHEMLQENFRFLSTLRLRSKP